MDICMWRKLYLDCIDGNGTTFEDCDKWGKNHGLYKCAHECDGYDSECGHYKPSWKYEVNNGTV